MALADDVAISALVVALVAGLVALAQVAQQYVGTAGLIQKCDSIVYGPLPGKRKRVFLWRQLRFKVVYSIPQISLSESLWAEMTSQSPLYSPPTRSLAPAIKNHDPRPSAGEASWVSFYKAVKNSCIDELRYQLLEGDADHCPAELPVVPMQVSMRDVIVLALMSGMRITDASFSRKLLLMQGSRGTISSAAHPVLGTILHFTPRIVAGNHGVTVTGKISPRWIRRLYGDCPVAGADITPFERYHIEKTEARWSKRILDYSGRPQYSFGNSRSDEASQDNQMVLYSNRHSKNSNALRVTSPTSALTSDRQNSKRVAFTAAPETRENRSQLYHTFSNASSQQSIIPWRKPWPEVEVDDTIDLTSLARQKQSRKGAHLENLLDDSSSILPEAPQAPSRGQNITSASIGIHDGTWSFSSKPSSFIILAPTLPKKRQVAKQNSKLRKLYRRVFSFKKPKVDEKEVLIQAAEPSPHYGWEMSDFFYLDPCKVPLPTELSRNSFSLESETPQITNPLEPIFPPDFLLYGKNISSKEGPHSVGMDRWYAAILRQKKRQEARAREMEDLHFIKNGKFNYSRSGGHQNGKTTKHSHPGPSRNNNHSGIPRTLYQISTDPDSLGRQSETITQHPDSGSSTNPVSYTPSRWFTQEHQSRETNLPHERIEYPTSHHQAYVESGDEDSDSLYGTSSFVDDNSDDDLGSLTSSIENGYANSGLRIVVRRPGSDSQQNYNDHGGFGNEKAKESDVERKIREAQEVAQRHRSKAEDPVRERDAYFRDAFIRENMRQKHIPEEQREAERRQRTRDEQRARRIEERLLDAQKGVVNASRSGTDVSWFWISQMDIIPGYFATTWSDQFSRFVATGTVAIVLEALLGFTDKHSLQYSWSQKRDVWDWLQAEKSTFPPYARNARGGVVITGIYQAVTFEAFEQKLPPLQLLHCYDYQVDRFPRIDDISLLNRQMELMGIDSWLSIVGRTPEITNGPANLLRTTPALVQKLMGEFGWSFQELDFYANEGGLQVIQDITENLLDALDDESLTEAEQLFVLVALLRTAKLALSICLGPSTEMAQGLLSVDMQVYLV